MIFCNRKSIIVTFLFIFLFSLSKANSEITSQEEASSFLSEYCITMVDEIEKSYKKQLEAIEKNRITQFHKTGKWIYGISELYSNLDCTSHIGTD